jgi:radical SAM-linked protein
MTRYRVRIRFHKGGDLRLIGHRDLVRTFERLFRRAGLALSMSEGFHPKPRMSFPSALALGIEGIDEVMEVEFAEEVSADDLHRLLTVHAPPGLVFKDVRVLGPADRKARVERVVYEMPLPRQRYEPLETAVEQLLNQSSYPIRRQGRKEPIDLRAGLEALQLVGGGLRMQLRVTTAADVRPREVLEALGVADLESQGYRLTRTAVEIAS